MTRAAVMASLCGHGIKRRIGLRDGHVLFFGEEASRLWWLAGWLFPNAHAQFFVKGERFIGFRQRRFGDFAD